MKQGRRSCTEIAVLPQGADPCLGLEGTRWPTPRDRPLLVLRSCPQCWLQLFLRLFTCVILPGIRADSHPTLQEVNCTYACCQFATACAFSSSMKSHPGYGVDVDPMNAESETAKFYATEVGVAHRENLRGRIEVCPCVCIYIYIYMFLIPGHWTFGCHSIACLLNNHNNDDTNHNSNMNNDDSIIYKYVFMYMCM